MLPPSHFLLFLIFLPENNYPDTHHSQGGLKFATQISPLLNFNFMYNCVLKTFFSGCLVFNYHKGTQQCDMIYSLGLGNSSNPDYMTGPQMCGLMTGS